MYILEEDKSLDILGIKPIGNSIETVTSKTMDGASSFLSRICLPAAEEFGFLLQDKVKNWRASNTKKILEKAEEKLSRNQNIKNKDIKAHPLIVWKILENGSWSEHNELHEIWSGLLASSCDEEGKDDSNLTFINIIAQMTELQVKVLNYACENSKFILRKAGVLSSEKLEVNLDLLQSITNTNDLGRLDRELDHLRNIGILKELSGGLNVEHLIADISPSDMGIHLYARCQGFVGETKDFYQYEAI